MDKAVKEALMKSVTEGTHVNVEENILKLILDETFFDYELLKAALKRKHQRIIYILLKHCRVRNPKTVNLEDTVLHFAMKLVKCKSTKAPILNILRKILKDGALISDKNHKGETALYAAFKEGYEFAVDVALTHMSNVDNAIRLNPNDKDDIVHFHIACIREHNDAIKLFLKHGFDVNSPISLDSAEYSGLNPLLYIANTENLCVFKTLLEQGDLSIKNSHGQTSLHILYYKGSTSMIESAFKTGNDAKFINFVDENGVSHFLSSCSINFPDMVKVFIDKGVDINSSISFSSSISPGFTALHVAVKYNCEEVVHLLLESGIDINKVDKEGSTPLHLAVKYKHEKIVKLLLENGCDCKKVDTKGNTPLHLASENIDGSKIMKILQDYAACAPIPNAFQYEPICKELYNNRVENNIIDMLISNIPREVDFINDEGLSHFHIVCTRNDVTRVKDFLRFGVAIDRCVVSGKCSGYTALHFAVLYNQQDVVQTLLKANARVNVKTPKCQVTPLHLACGYSYHKIKFCEMIVNDRSDNYTSNRKSHLDIIKLLLLFGADVDAQDSLGATPLILSCTNDKEECINYTRPELIEEISQRTKEVVKILLSEKANVNARTNCQETILHNIGKKHFPFIPDLVEYLINQGADLQATDNAGLTPLHTAVKSAYKCELIQLYLNHKADVNAKSKDSLIPLQLALQNYYESQSSCRISDILFALLENDSDVDVIDENNKTLLDTAITKLDFFVTEQLLRYGADINLEDSSGTVAVSSLLQSWGNPHIGNYRNTYKMELTEEKYANVFKRIFVHVQRLLALGCYISEKVQTCCTKLHERYKVCNLPRRSQYGGKVNFDSCFDNCTEELNRMKLIKIDRYTSLFNILQKDVHELSKHVRNNTLVKILEDQNLKKNFPLYSSLLKVKYKKGLKRNDVLKIAKSPLIRFNLPDLCWDLVLKYLTNKEISNFIAAAKSSCKKKLQSNDSNDAEPSAKLQKKV